MACSVSQSRTKACVCPRNFAVTTGISIKKRLGVTSRVIARCGTRILRNSSSVHLAGFFRAAAGEAEAVFGEDSVAEVERMRDTGETCGPDEPSETDGGVELAEDFDADDPTVGVAVFAG